MGSKKKSRIEYVGFKEVYGGTILKTINIKKPIFRNKEKENIFRVQFNSDILELQKILKYDHEDVFIFHVFLQWEIFCQTTGEEPYMETYKEERIDSYLVSSCPKIKEAEALKGEVAVINGYVEEYEEEEYIILEVALILGGFAS